MTYVRVALCKKVPEIALTAFMLLMKVNYELSCTRKQYQYYIDRSGKQMPFGIETTLGLNTFGLELGQFFHNFLLVGYHRFLPVNNINKQG